MKLTIAKYYTPSGRCVQRLEYYDRNEGAKPEDVPDSLLHVFKTKNGRDVIDGRGIEPDMKVEAPELSRLALMIYANNVLFNYVTDYVKTHPSIAPAEQFRLSDEDYEAFKKYAIQDTFTYSTASEEQLMKMQKTIEKENLMDDAKAEYEALMAKITPSKERDLVKFEAQIRQLIENEIVSRYYFQQGRVQNSFNHDEVLKKGIEVLNNTQQYNTILKK